MKNMNQPNIIFLHSHNTGRHIQPYGRAVPTPNLQRLAQEGVLFRQAFSAAPTCSPSRASFHTGLYPHAAGMLGLSHRGFGAAHYPLHLTHRLSSVGYHTVQCGIDHTVHGKSVVVPYAGYAQMLESDGAKAEAVTSAVVSFLHAKQDRPFFMSVGLRETHTPFHEPQPHRGPAEDARYVLPPAGLPDTAATRCDTAAFAASARIMDDVWGSVLQALDDTGLAQNTLVFAFSDHGLQFPLHMANCTDRGLSVYMIARGPGGFQGGKVVDAMVSLLDMTPTICDLAGAPSEPTHGRSLLPLVNNEVDHIHDVLFGEQSYHAAYEPQRTIRTKRYRYVRRFDDRALPVLPNTDDGLSKSELLACGGLSQPRDKEMLFDLWLDRDEYHNIIDRPDMSEVAAELRASLQSWMEQTQDPIWPGGKVAAPAGARANRPDQASWHEPTVDACETV